jgi:hypothetical protein
MGSHHVLLDRTNGSQYRSTMHTVIHTLTFLADAKAAGLDESELSEIGN